MEVGTMKAKNLMVGIKQGMTLEDFCIKYQCSAEDFEGRMRQIYSHNKKQLKNCMSQISANEKKARKDSGPVVAPEEELPVSGFSGAEEVATLGPEPTELEQLRELEVRQSQKVMDLETEHKSLVSEHRSLRSKLQEISADIDELTQKLQARHQEFEDILAKNETVEGRMTEISAEWNAEGKALASTRERIEELLTLVLCVYSSGEITSEGCNVDELDDSGWEDVYDVLLSRDECEELRVKEIKTLARLLTIVAHTEYRVEVVCDSAEMEEAFQLLRSNS